MQTKRKQNRKKGIYENSASRKMEHTSLGDFGEDHDVYLQTDRLLTGWKDFLDPLERLYGVCCNTESCQGAVLRSSLVEELTCKKEVDKEVPSKPLLVVLA